MPDGKLTLIKLLDTQSNEEIETFQDFSATLLQIPGQKYAIGSSYEGKKENEEFVFFQYSFEKEQNFQINVDENGSFWIRRESKQYGLSVNGIPVKGKKAFKLTFGDTIELPYTNSPPERRKKEGVFQKLFGKNGSKRMIMCSKAAILTFREREFKWPSKETISLFKTDDPETDPAFLVGSNELIIQAIVSYLPIQMLPNLRLVSPLWNSLTLPLVSCLPTFLCPPSKKPVVLGTESRHNIYNGDDGTLFFRYEKEMQEFPSKKLVFSLKVFENASKNFSEVEENFQKPLSERWRKYEDDLSKFLPPLTHRIQDLVIPQNQISMWRAYIILNKVFKTLSPGLESLQLCDQPPKWDEYEDPETRFSGDWTFRNLKTLKTTLNLDTRKDLGGTEKWAKDVVGKLGPSFQKYEGLGGPFFQEICVKKFPNLSSVSLLRVSFEYSELELLKGLNPLRNLCLYEIKSFDDISKILSDVLERHSKTLKTLVLFVFTWSNLLLPSFQVLDDFTIVCGRFVKFKQEVKYHKHFPALKRLIMGWAERVSVIENLRKGEDFLEGYELVSRSNFLNVWNETNPLFDSFFPYNYYPQICKTLKSLKIYNFDNEIAGNYFQQDPYGRVKRIRRMFPNCDIDWLERRE